MSTLESALALAAKGFRVFPIPANSKKAVLLDFPDKATADPDKIRQWWTDWDGTPMDHNIGISTDDLLVIDIEGKAKSGVDPLETLSAIEAELGRLHFMVDTPSGGYHAYMRLPAGRRVANTSKTLWPGVDTRSWHGYVLADGSTVDGKSYGWSISIPDENRPPISIDELPTAPDDLLDRIGTPRDKADLPSNINYDTPDAIQQATDYLKRAKPAIEGDGGDLQTYRVAARVRDLAVSQETALDLMLDHWNPRCEPPWDPEHLEKKIDNAYRYAENTPHEPGSEFGPVDVGSPASGLSGDLAFHPHGPIDLNSLPQRHWLIEGVAARGFVTLISAPPGSGKTQLVAQLMLSAAHNAPVAGFPVREPTAVWSYNAEDDTTELQRRVGAAMLAHNLQWETRTHDWAISSGVDHPLTVAKWDTQLHRLRIDHNAIANLRSNIVKHNIGILILDPFADIHDAPESDNDAIKRVMGIFTQLAKDTNIAVIIPTHTRKLPNASSDGHAGNAESVRGASAMVAKARVVLTLMPMSPKEAKAHQIDPKFQGHYMRIDTAKNNLGPTERGAKPLWMKWESTPLPNGDKVGVLAPVALEQVESRVKKERPVGEEFQDEVALAIADQLGKSAEPATEVMWSVVRAAMGPMGSKGGVLEKYAAKALGGGARSPWIEAGKGVKIRFRKATDARVRVCWMYSDDAYEGRVEPLLDASEGADFDALPADERADYALMEGPSADAADAADIWSVLEG